MHQTLTEVKVLEQGGMAAAGLAYDKSMVYATTEAPPQQRGNVASLRQSRDDAIAGGMRRIINSPLPAC